VTEYRSLLERAGSNFPALDLEHETILRSRDRKRRSQRVAAGIVGIAVFVTAVWMVTSGASPDRSRTPANQPSTLNRTHAAEEVARGFLAAYGAFDPEAAMAYAADDAHLNEKGLSLELALFDAQRVQLTITSCQAVPFGSATSVVCRFDFQAIASDLLGLGPFKGGAFVFTVRDGKIVKFASIGKISEFKAQMRAPFAEWVAATYPRDFAVMYGRSIPLRSSGFTRVRGRPTEESIRLWRVHIPEYVEAVQQGTA
jgi:hypothetical protein